MPDPEEIAFGDYLDQSQTQDTPTVVDDPIEPKAPEAIKPDPIEPVVPAAPTAATPVTGPAPIEPVTDEVTDPVEEPLWKELLTKSGYDLGNEEFEDTPEGLLKMTEKLSEKRAEETLDAIFEAFPSVKRHLEFVRMGGDPEKLLAIEQEPEWTKFDITTDEAQKNVLRQYFKARGEAQEFIEDTIEMYGDKKILADRAASARKALADHQESRKQALVEQQKQIEAKNRAAAEETWKSVQKRVNEANDLNGLPVSVKDRGAFLDYISKPVDRHGRTQRDLDAAKLDLDKQLTLDYILYKQFKLGNVIQAKARTEAAESLRSRLRGADNRKPSGRQPGNPTGEEVVTLDELL